MYIDIETGSSDDNNVLLDIHPADISAPSSGESKIASLSSSQFNLQCSCFIFYFDAIIVS